MSTRSLITCKDENGEHHVYRHSDGYPDSESGVLADLQRVIDGDKVWPLPRFEADEFSAGIIAELKDRSGNYRLSSGPEAHGDIEYWYVVTPDHGGIRVAWTGHGQSRVVYLQRTP